MISVIKDTDMAHANQSSPHFRLNFSQNDEHLRQEPIMNLFGRNDKVTWNVFIGHLLQSTTEKFLLI